MVLQTCPWMQAHMCRQKLQRFVYLLLLKRQGEIIVHWKNEDQLPGIFQLPTTEQEENVIEDDGEHGYIFNGNNLCLFF